MRHYKLDLLGIRETKMESLSRLIGARLWDDDYFDWVWQPSQGASGGLILMWQTTVFSMVESFQGEGFIGVRWVWGTS